jgi:hypothetical protein
VQTRRVGGLEGGTQEARALPVFDRFVPCYNCICSARLQDSCILRGPALPTWYTSTADSAVTHMTAALHQKRTPDNRLVRCSLSVCGATTVYAVSGGVCRCSTAATSSGALPAVSPHPAAMNLVSFRSWNNNGRVEMCDSPSQRLETTRAVSLLGIACHARVPCTRAKCCWGTCYNACRLQPKAWWHSLPVPMDQCASSLSFASLQGLFAAVGLIAMTIY